MCTLYTFEWHLQEWSFHTRRLQAHTGKGHTQAHTQLHRCLNSRSQYQLLYDHTCIAFSLLASTLLYSTTNCTQKARRSLFREHIYSQKEFICWNNLILLLPSSRDILCQFWRASTPPRWTDQRRPFSYRTWWTVRSTLQQGSAYCCSGTSQQPAKACNKTCFKQQPQISLVRTRGTTQQLTVYHQKSSSSFCQSLQHLSLFNRL